MYKDFLKLIFSIDLIDFSLIEKGIIFIVAIISPFFTLELLFNVAIVMLLEVLLNLRILSSLITSKPDSLANIFDLPVNAFSNAKVLLLNFFAKIFAALSS